jgi:hypothetical protein
MLKSLSSFYLAFAFPSITDAAIGYLCFTLVVGRVYHMFFWLSVENQVFGKLRKQLS